MQICATEDLARKYNLLTLFAQIVWLIQTALIQNIYVRKTCRMQRSA